MAKIIRNLFTELYGIPSWNVKKGHGSFLTFEFGDPSIDIGKIYEASQPFGFKYQCRPAYVHGAWHLWIYMCEWNILWKDQEICESESDDLTIHRACGFLNGQALESVTVKADGATHFNFDLDGHLKTVPYSDSEPENTWILFCPDKRIFSLRSDRYYSIEQNDEDSSGEVYLELK